MTSNIKANEKESEGGKITAFELDPEQIKAIDEFKAKSEALDGDFADYLPHGTHVARRGGPDRPTIRQQTEKTAFSTIQKDIRRSKMPGDIHERRAIDFTKRLYAIKWLI